MSTSILIKAQEVKVTSSNLPLIIINTNGKTISDEPKVEVDMGIIYNGEGVRNNLSDPFNHFNGKVGIEVRGQSSQSFPMKSYTIEIHDALGMELEVPLFGMHKESDWVLYAPYTDKSLMRNVLAYTLARDMGRWAAHCKYVELIIDGSYKGVYVFMEKIKWGKGRVDIAKMTELDNSDDALTGGYIFSLDKQPNGWISKYPTPFSTNNNTRQFSYIYPRPQFITEVQKSYIKSAVDKFEDALWSANYQDPVSGFRKYADVSSFIDYMIVNEVSKNVDGYRLSSYFHKDRDSRNPKIFAGPVWDYDLAFRNADYCSGSTIVGWAYQFNIVCPGDGAGLIPFWWEKFMQDSSYQGELRCRYQSLLTKELSQQRLNNLIDSITSVVAEAQVRHFTQWPILGKYVWPNPQPLANTYAEEIANLKGWLFNRISWINDNLPNKGNCYDFPVNFNGTMMVKKVIGVPITTNSTILIESKLSQEITMVVTDMLGRVIKKQNMSLYYGINNISLNPDS
ncbi:MAG: CotH kinase family protein, partial [Chitinophagaceae bacterium]